MFTIFAIITETFCDSIIILLVHRSIHAISAYLRFIWHRNIDFCLVAAMFISFRFRFLSISLVFFIPRALPYNGQHSVNKRDNRSDKIGSCERAFVSKETRFVWKQLRVVFPFNYPLVTVYCLDVNPTIC